MFVHQFPVAPGNTDNWINLDKVSKLSVVQVTSSVWEVQAFESFTATGYTVGQFTNQSDAINALNEMTSAQGLVVVS